MDRKKRIKKKSRRLRFVLSCLLTFVMSVVFTVASILCSVKIGFLNADSILDGMALADYYKGVEEDFYQDARDFTIPVGLPEHVVDGIIDSETVYRDVTAYVTNAVDDRIYEFDTKTMESRLTENIHSYFQQEGLQMNEEQIQTIPEYVTMIADIYKENVRVDYTSVLGKVNHAMENYVLLGVAACLVLGIVISFVLVRMYYWKHRGMRFVVYGTITTAVMMITPPILVSILGNYMKPNIAPEYFYHGLINYCANGLQVFVYFAIGWAAISAALLLWIRYLKKNS